MECGGWSYLIVELRQLSKVFHINSPTFQDSINLSCQSRSQFEQLESHFNQLDLVQKTSQFPQRRAITETCDHIWNFQEERLQMTFNSILLCINPVNSTVHLDPQDSTKTNFNSYRCLVCVQNIIQNKSRSVMVLNILI
jgi:hypothetical protein